MTENLLQTTTKLESMISDIRSISTAMGVVAHKLSTNEVITNTDRNNVQVSYEWISSPEIARILDIVNADFPTDLEKLGHADDEAEIAVNKSFSFEFGQGLDDAHDLDWDIEGIELSASSANAIMQESNTKLSPLDSACNFSEFPNPEKQEKVKLNSCSSYNGVYEEVMEMSLELEEGFYSEDEYSNDTGLDGDDAVISYVLRETNSNFEVYQIDDKIGLNMSPALTSHCNYQLVSIDDDMQSVDSEYSNNSPFHQVRMKKLTSSAKVTTHACGEKVPLSPKVSTIKRLEIERSPSPLAAFRTEKCSTMLPACLKRNNYIPSGRQAMFV